MWGVIAPLWHSLGSGRRVEFFQCFELRCWTGNGESGGRWKLELLTATTFLHCKKLWFCQHSVTVRSGEGSVTQGSAAGMKGTGKRDDYPSFSVHCLLWKGITYLIPSLLFQYSSPQSTMCGCWSPPCCSVGIWDCSLGHGRRLSVCVEIPG